jgi:hypothetical protein
MTARPPAGRHRSDPVLETFHPIVRRWFGERFAAPTAPQARYTLTDAEVTAGFSTRAQIFSAFSGGAGWNPQP